MRDDVKCARKYSKVTCRTNNEICSFRRLRNDILLAVMSLLSIHGPAENARTLKSLVYLFLYLSLPFYANSKNEGSIEFQSNFLLFLKIHNWTFQIYMGHSAKILENHNYFSLKKISCL